MVNNKHDAHSYESIGISGESGYKREIYNGNVLYEGYLRAKQGSDWKPQVQKFGMYYLLELAKMSREIRDKTYEFLPTSHFILNERGRTRSITGEQIPDRILKHALCDEFLNPAVKKYLIYDNGASVKGKGTSFTRQRIVDHLHRYYNKHGSNDGYILLIDFSKYYDNIRHDKLYNMLADKVDNEHALWLLSKTLNNSAVDVSYMTDEEYSNCINVLFNSLEHDKIDKSLLTGQKYMAKHMNIGDQVSQTAGVTYRTPVDNYVKIVNGVSLYGVYNDDSYVIHENKEFLEELLKGIIEAANSLGITVNTKKTRICKLSDRWRFLQVSYSLTKTGKVVQKINTKRLTAMRRKMKSVVYKLPKSEFIDWYKSWFDNYHKLMSKQQRNNMNGLFNKLIMEVYDV